MRESLQELERHGFVPLGVAGRMVLVPAFNDEGVGLHVLLNENRLPDWNRLFPGYRDQFCHMKQETWGLLAQLFAEYGIKSVCGQVASGSSIAFALQVISENRLISSVLGKDGYATAKHCRECCYSNRVAIVDDVVSEGDAMRWSINRLKEMGYEQRPVLFSFYWANAFRHNMFGEDYEMITVIGSMEE